MVRRVEHYREIVSMVLTVTEENEREEERREEGAEWISVFYSRPCEFYLERP